TQAIGKATVVGGSITAITLIGCDYYEIELGEYNEKMHTDLPATRLRGYRQTNTADPTVSRFHQLGPVIVSQKDRPVRIKFTNKLPRRNAGKLFIPVDFTVMGAGMGPLGMGTTPGYPVYYTENRATIHLHGGIVPWISDGTPYQWTTPAGELTDYPKGESVYNVPDMPNAGPNPPQGVLTFYYTNQQSSRLMFYHDHAHGITRLNVYAGEAAGYLVTDEVEQDLITGSDVSGVNPDNKKVLPDLGIPLVIQDRTFVDARTIRAQDPTWNWGTTRPAPRTGDLWYPHVYVPAQNPYDPSGVNPFGRWHYGPWFWPPVVVANGTVPNPYYGTAPWEPPRMPGTPNPSAVGEAFMDTPIVNGAVYPFVNVQPKAYRFRILNAADDRFVNLQLYQAYDPATGKVGSGKEVKMIDARPNPAFPPDWPTDGRAGGVPAPATRGPSFIQIGTESGFLPAPVVVENQPVTWVTDPTLFNFGNVDKHALLIAPAERADVIIDFSRFAGKTLILYNDAPAAFPALDPRYDYYTGKPDLTDTGGTPTTQPGYGPNIRTIMQIRVANTSPATPYDLSTLNAVFEKTATKRGVFEASQPGIIIPQANYNSAYNGNFAQDTFVRIYQYTTHTFRNLTGGLVTLPIQAKAIHDEMGAAFDQYGRMSGMLGIEMVPPTATAQNLVLYGYSSPPTDFLDDTMQGTQVGSLGDGTQLWKITHNGVDTHPVHWHLVHLQLINRVGWDGFIREPDPNELGWKDTIRISPLEDTIVAVRAVSPKVPFDVPNSIRAIDPTMPLGVKLNGGPGGLGFMDPQGNPVNVVNHMVNLGWEEVWHCHILAHEEMDMMHNLVIGGKPDDPSSLSAVRGTGNNVRLTWQDNSVTETHWAVYRATSAAGPYTLINTIASNSGPQKGSTKIYTDGTAAPGPTYRYRVRAVNWVGDTRTYPAPSVGFPNRKIASGISNTATVA
ncbi:MAG: multicopper oxidase domain-containing protein, partial [Methanoregulaceae archaeon]|nr:multicopper oxidase domain-containing protein [Methanoregulaceae archaeon]